MSKQKGFTLVEGLLIVLVVSFIGFAGWYVWDKQNVQQKDETTPQGSTQTVPSENPDVEKELVTAQHDFTYEDPANGLGVSIDHPDTWTAETFTGNAPEDNPRNFLKITSSEGYVVYVNDGDGIGYSCDKDPLSKVTYTIKDVVQTNTSTLQYMLVEASEYATTTIDGQKVVVDSQDTYVPVDTSAGTHPFAGLSIGDTKVIDYTNTYECTPLMGPKSSYKYSINVVVEKPGDQLSTFSDGITKELMENQEIRSIIESLKIEEK